jgi:hypothetical protein
LFYLFQFFFGSGKSGDFCSFLTPFVNEMLEIQKEFTFRDQKINVNVRASVLDYPAKAATLGIKSFNAEASCSKCTIRGNHSNFIMSFASDNLKNISLRTDSDFRLRTDPNHHRYLSPIEKLDIDLIDQIANEPMHLIYLGVMKQL